jgi:NDP-hexose C3-ketoreductase / dTDP-4-oxo-2-deoxy-alpha-D-pentos-2-ene 2,3-reductase
MEYTHLGRTGLTVSRIGLGALKAAAPENLPGAHALMDRAVEHGINYLDTSNIYGLQDGDDWSENVIGRWLAQGGGRRERTVLATKLYQAQDDWPNHGRLSALHIRQACDDSLRRLQTDHIDLYQMHHVDRATPWEEIWEAMEVLRAQGKIIYVGSSNFAGWHIARAQEKADARHFLGLVNEQSIYNLAVRDIEREVIPAIQAYGLGLSVWSPLYRGILGGILAEEKAGGPRNSRVSAGQLDRLRPQLTEYEKLCGELGYPPARVALAWLLQRPGVTSAIVGPNTIEQLDGTVAALDLHLDDQARTRLDEIFPGYRTAPEDYAW